ncbi:SDR family oxidoreductase [Pseudarthrobacter sp. IC2-21]|uniref:SDR family oxidoreductase n=1 Tax=Pseudarthrobacter sp. IC2-21 TaxID=3092262 RepID=UPI002A69E4D8|nr:SDR family oxidoreductase [Pseudarthrobacter sp. IC2-21]
MNEQGGKGTVESIQRSGGTAQFARADITDEFDVQSLVQEASSACGKLDGAFDNAGIIGPGGPVADFSYQDWQKVLDINLNGLFLCLKYEIPAILAAGGGAIVNTSSTAGAIAYPNLPA